MDSNINLDQLKSRLQIVEERAKQSGGLNAVTAYAGGVTREIVNPLEALNNLVYLMAHSLEEPTKIALYVEMAEGELRRLNEIAKRTIQFCNENHSATQSP